ncbi:MAG TPA: hypothetical protein VN831_03740 [Bradyrhizobium sp.]|jgi:hypothetical protein|nr:hypothetical protein [Bradyrhizobium sp.]
MTQADSVFSTPPTNTSPLRQKAAIALPETERFDADPPQRAPMVGARPTFEQVIEDLRTRYISDDFKLDEAAAAAQLRDQFAAWFQGIIPEPAGSRRRVFLWFLPGAATRWWCGFRSNILWRV